MCLEAAAEEKRIVTDIPTVGVHVICNELSRYWRQNNAQC